MGLIYYEFRPHGFDLDGQYFQICVIIQGYVWDPTLNSLFCSEARQERVRK